MSAKTSLKVAIAIAFILVAYYFLSPFVTLRTLADAARTGDKDVIALKVDFPALRESLKGQFNTFVMKKAISDPELKGNPFAGFAMMLVPMMIDKMVDNFITADGIASALNRPATAEPQSSAIPALWKGDFSYLDLDHFRATYTNVEHPDQPLGIVLERHGLFGWKLSSLDLPLDQLADASSDKSERQTVPPMNPLAANPNKTLSENTLPESIGQCVVTYVTGVGTRLQDGTNGQPIPGSGSAIKYSNGGYQVSYEQISGIDDSRSGDAVRLCLVSIPPDCPPGDERGKIYHTTNLRTNEEWEEPDSEHSCGGA